MRRLVACLAGLLCLPPVAADTDPYALEMSGFVDGYVTGRMLDRGVVGVTVSIVRDGERVLSKGYGFDDLGKRRPVDSSRSLFRPGSISKTFTWTALMQLQEQGKVRLDTDISEYLPQIRLPDTFGQPVTILDLMAHRPGFEDSSVGHLIIDRPDHVQTLVDYLQSHQPAQVYAPGSTPAYSNYGSGLAGLIVANVSGMPFEDYVETHLFEPLGMVNSTFREPWGAQRPGAMSSAQKQDASKGYIRRGASWESTDYEFIGQIGPAGAMATTADDMARWMLAHLGGGAVGQARILRPETAELMHRQHSTLDPRLPGLAHGFIEQHLHGYAGYGHSGGTAHFFSDMVMVPELGLGIFISTNTSEGGGRLIQGFTRDFIRRFYPPGPLLHDEEPDTGLATEAGRQDVAGSWVVSRRSHTGPEKLATPMASVSFDTQGNLVLGGMGEFLVFRPAGTDRWRGIDDPDDQLIFERDASGTPVRLLTSIPILVATRPTFGQRAEVNLGVLAGATLLFTGTLLLAWRRMGRGLRPTPAERRASLWTTLAATAWLAAITSLALGAAGMSDPRAALFHYPTTPILTALWSTLLALLLTAIALALSIPALQGGSWNMWRRARHVLVLLAAVMAGLVMWNNNLVGFNHL